MTDNHNTIQAKDAALASTPAPQDPHRAEEQQARMPAAGKEMGQALQELTAQGQEVAAEYYQQGRERLQAWQQQLEHQVREKPLQSLLMAAGLGLLFGILRRR